jgi:N-acetylglutamate synthase/N-acetylornithine aminotransferase
MSKVNTLSDKQGELDEQALRIDIKNLRNSVNELYNGLSQTQTFKDGDGVTKTMTITNGRITAIS